MKNNWNKILNELSYRVSSGIPDLSNEQHLIKLWDILKEHKWPVDARVELLKNLDEVVKKRYYQTDKGQSAPKGAKVGVGPDGGTYYWANPDNSPAAAEDIPKEKGSKEKGPDKKRKGQQKSAGNLIKNFDIEQKKSNDPQLTEEEIKHMENFKNLGEEFTNPNTSEERKKEIATELVDTFGLTTNKETINEDGKKVPVKLYVKKNHDGGEVPRSVETMVKSGSWAPSSPMSNLVNELNEYLPEDKKIKPNTIGGLGEKELKTLFEKLAKPKFKGESTYTKKDPTVNSIFKEDTPIGDLKESMHKIEGPGDKDGNLVPCDTDENKRKHIDFLINQNESFDRVKKQCDDFINDSDMDKTQREKFRKLKKSIEDYEKDMNEVIKDIPSEAAQKRVDELNGKLMDDLHNATPDLAKGMAKQFAENAEVTREIAGGDEVYMPSSGTFPGGDKLVVTREGTDMVAITGISVKYGRANENTQIYGFPAEAQSISRFADIKKNEGESDEDYKKRKTELRTRNGKFAGQDGYALAVRDDIVTDQNKFNKTLESSGLDKAVKDKKGLHKLNNEIRSETIRFQEEQRKKDPPPSERAIQIQLQDHLNKYFKDNKIQDRFDKLIDKKVLMKTLTGSEDGKREDGKSHSNRNLVNSMNPIDFLGVSTMGSTIKEGGGMPTLSWNHQAYEQGEHKSGTIDPDTTDTTLLSNWSFSPRHYVTSGRKGGGTLCSVIGGNPDDSFKGGTEK